MIIYTSHISSRFEYIVETLFENSVSITNQKSEFENYTGAKINYSSEILSCNAVQVTPHQLLFEKNICQQTIECFEWNELKAFFKTNGDIPFDIFAASFFLISRYEEYLSYEPDMYKRFPHENSIAFKENFLHLPLINLWLCEFEKKLQSKFPSFLFDEPSFKIIPTYDIDIAFKYTEKGFFRNTVSFLKSSAKLNFKEIKTQFAVFSKKTKDPFDVFEMIEEIHKKNNLNAHYFFLLAKKRSIYDKNIPPGNKALQSKIKNIAVKNIVGIHPSWKSCDDEKVLQNEINTLSSLLPTPVLHSRQHYIRMKFPETYRTLLENNIQHDWSLGYGSINGFRASYAKSFVWYDLEAETKTTLNIHPFCYMDANAIFEEKLTPLQALKELKHYFFITKKVNGEFVFIHHNHFLAKEAEWIEWRKIYEETMNSI